MGIKDAIREGAQGVTLLGGRRAVLLVHGFGDTVQSVGAMAVYLNRCGFTVRAPLLVGHGRTVSELSGVGARVWRSQIRAEYERLIGSYSVSCVGFSMGGALAADLARSVRIDRLVLLAPYVSLPLWLRPLAATGGLWGPVVGAVKTGGGGSLWDPVAQREALGYSETTGRALNQLARVARWGWEAAPYVDTPTLLVQSLSDNRVEARTSVEYMKRLGGVCEVVWTVGAGHIITADYGKEIVWRIVRRWLEVPLVR